MVADAEQVLITCAVLSDIPEELGDYRLVSVTAGHAEYVQPATASAAAANSEGSTVSALAEGDGDE
jgi:DNA replication and repair protein recF